MRRIWAITIAVGVYSSCRKPRSDLLERRRATIRPITTDGIPMREKIILAKRPSPLNFFSPRATPRGSTVKRVNNVAIAETPMERKIIL